MNLVVIETVEKDLTYKLTKYSGRKQEASSLMSINDETNLDQIKEVIEDFRSN